MTKARDLGDNAQNTKPKVIDAKGDLIVGTGADAASRLATGNNGETLVADSSASTGLRYIPYGSINYQTNGGFDIWQRGTSIAVGTAFTYTADRWQGWRNALASGMTVSRQTSDLDGFQYYARLQRDSGNTSTQTLFFGSSLETQTVEMLQGQFVTLSFWARKGANYSGGTFDAYIFTGTGTDQNISALSTNAGSLASSLTTSWVRYSITTSAAVANTVTSLGIRLGFVPTGTAGAADYVDLAGVQIEVGSAVTTFRRSGGTLAGELAACQRYYIRYNSTVDTNAPFANGICYSTTAARMYFGLPVQMRGTAVTVDFSTLQFIDSSIGVYTVSAVTSPFNFAGNSIMVDATISGGTQGRSGWLRQNGAASSSFIGFSAEL